MLFVATVAHFLCIGYFVKLFVFASIKDNSVFITNNAKLIQGAYDGQIGIQFCIVVECAGLSLSLFCVHT